jgi:hypothetical protein
VRCSQRRQQRCCIHFCHAFTRVRRPIISWRYSSSPAATSQCSRTQIGEERAQTTRDRLHSGPRIAGRTWRHSSDIRRAAAGLSPRHSAEVQIAMHLSLTAEGWPGSCGRPEQAAQSSVVKRRGGAEVRVGCSGAAATCGSHKQIPGAELKLCPTSVRSALRASCPHVVQHRPGPRASADVRPRGRLTDCGGPDAGAGPALRRRLRRRRSS